MMGLLRRSRELVPFGNFGNGSSSTINSAGPSTEATVALKTAMSLKAELQTWDAAVKAFEAEDWNVALDLFQSLADTAKMHFNLGMTYQRLRQYNEAVIAFGEAIDCDNFLSIAYFQRGVCYYIMGHFENALEDFNDSIIYLRGNTLIDYTQLGLEYRLYGAEALYNRALCQFQLGAETEAINDLREALRIRELPEHDQIERAIEYRFQDCRPFHVPEHLIYKPPATKLENAKKKDYLGQPKVVAALNEQDNYAGFSGSQSRRQTEGDASHQGFQYTTLSRTGSTADVPARRKASAPPEFASMPRQDTMSSVRRQNDFPTSGRQNEFHTTGRQNEFHTQRSLGNVSGPRSNLPAVNTRAPIPQRMNTQDSVSRTPGWGGPKSSPYAHSSSTIPRDRDEISPSSASTLGSAGAPTLSRPGMIKLRCHFDSDTRAILVSKESRWEDLQMRLAEKYKVGISSDGELPFTIQYKDEDGHFIRIEDDEDWFTALDEAEGTRLQLWLRDRAMSP